MSEQTPPWFENMRLALSPVEDSAQYLTDLIYLAPRVQDWLDGTHVAGSPKREEMAKTLAGWYQSFCDWTVLLARPENPGVELARVTGVRLVSLTNSFR